MRRDRAVRSGVGGRAAFPATSRAAAVAVDDRWHIGSNLKAVVGMLAGIAVDHGKIEWTTTVEEVFPELATPSAGSRHHGDGAAGAS